MSLGLALLAFTTLFPPADADKPAALRDMRPRWGSTSSNPRSPPHEAMTAP